MKFFTLRKGGKKKSGRIPQALIKKLSGLSAPGKRTAVFDLDNTLINGDIGDALFARLKDLDKREAVRPDGIRIGFTWERYQDLLSAGDREHAYMEVVRCMDGVPVKLVADLTRSLMNSDFRFLEHAGDKIPIPHLSPVMTELIGILRDLDYDIRVISASNVHSVRVICQEFLGLDPGNCFGIEPETGITLAGEPVLKGRLKEPIPVNEGKRSLYLDLFGNIPPLLTAGDSILDLPMLELVADGGAVIWRGSDDHLGHIRDRLGGRAEIFHLIETEEGFGEKDEDRHPA